MIGKIYAGLGGGALVVLLLAQFGGYCFSQYDKVPNVPTSVRNNPGSYRSHYTTYYVHVGGK